MLWNASNIIGYATHATDGVIGSIEDFLFGDGHWRIRWAVADTGGWLSGRKVLLPPASINNVDPSRREMMVNFSKKQIEEAPSIAMDLPVSRQHEAELYDFYRMNPYWAAGAGDGMFLAPPLATSIAAELVRAPEETRPKGDPHLRAVSEVKGYYIHARDEDIGHVEDFLIDSEDWSIRYLVVDTVNWLPGKKTLVSPHSFNKISWQERSVTTDLTQEQILGAPEYNPLITVDRAYEEKFHQYYSYPGYW